MKTLYPKFPLIQSSSCCISTWKRKKNPPWIESGSEYAALLPLQKMAINDEKFSEGRWIGFDRDEGTIAFAKGSNRN
jgi:hypothetical protein